MIMYSYDRRVCCIVTDSRSMQDAESVVVELCVYHWVVVSESVNVVREDFLTVWEANIVPW